MVDAKALEETSVKGGEQNAYQTDFIKRAS